MKIKSRLLATLLAVLMIIGSIPLMISADDATTAADLPTITKPALAERVPLDVDDIASKGGTVIQAFDFQQDVYTAGSFLNGKQSALYAVSAADNYFKDGNKNLIQVKQSADGNKYYQYAKKDGAANADHYFDIMFCASNGDAALEAAKNLGKIGASFVFTMDFMPGTFTGTLATLTTRYSSGQHGDGFAAVKVAENVLQDKDGNKIATLTEGEFSTVAVLFVPGTTVDNSKYYVYVNGVCVTPEGVTFLDASWMEKIKDADGDGTITPADYVPNHIRIAQMSAALANDMAFDNIAIYYSDTYLYEFTPTHETGFYEEGGKVYYVEDGALKGNADLGGFKTDKYGVVYRPVRVGNFVDLANLYDSQSSTDKKRDVVIKRTALMPNQSDVPGVRLWNVTQIKTKDKWNLPINSEYKTNAIAEHDGIEFVYYGNDTENTTIMLAIYSKMANPSNTSETGKAYVSKDLDFFSEQKTLYGYKDGDSNKAWGSKTYKNGIPANTWQSAMLEINDINWSKGRDYFTFSDAAGLADNLQIITTGWNLDYVWENNNKDNKGTQIANDGTETVTFAGIYVVDYVYATSISDVEAGYINVGGVNVPLYGTNGWATYGGKQYYYAPWTGELVRGSSFVDIKTDLCYTADANGACTLTNGAVKMGAFDYYYVNGVATTGVQTIGNDVKYVTSAGVVNKDYAGYTYPAAYVEQDHGDVSADTSYSHLMTFDNSTFKNDQRYNTTSDLTDIDKGGIGWANKSTVFELVEDSAGDKALKMYNMNTSVDPFFQYNPSIKTEQIVLEFDIKLGEDWNVDMSAMVRDEKGGANTTEKNQEFQPYHITSKGYFTTNNNVAIAEVSTTEYTRFSMVIDMTAHNVDYYVNGVLVVENSGFNASCLELDLLRLFQYASSGDNRHGTLYIDNIATYAAAQPVGVVSGTLTTGAVKYADGTLRFYKNGIPDTAGIVEYEDKLYEKKEYGVAVVASGTVGGKLYIDGELAEGDIDGKWYDAGYLLNGINKADGLMYANGIIANGQINGRWYFEGVMATGNVGGKWYDDGYLREGKYEGKIYEGGVLLSGTAADGLFYQSGEVYNGLYGVDNKTGTYYVDGKASEGYVVDADAKLAYIYGADGKCAMTYNIDYFNVTLIIKVDGVEEAREIIAVTNGNTFKLNVPSRDGYTTKINNAETSVIDVIVGSEIVYEINYITNP